MAYFLKDNEGNNVKHNDEDVFAVDFHSSVKQVDVKKRTLTMIGTDETIDREGDIIRMSGWELENYLKNPVFLWAHDYRSVPLGAASKIVKRRSPSPHMEFNLRFPTEGIHPFADMILSLYGEKIINASSVGFLPKKFEPREKDEDEDEDEFKRFWAPRMFIKQELLELSGVPVPANPNALQNALKEFKNIPIEPVQGSISFGDHDIGLLGFTVDEEFLINPKHKDDILKELEVKELEVVDEDEPKIHQVPDNIEKEADVEEEVEEIEGLPEDAEFFEGPEEKPYPNEHACRIKSPNYDRYARKNCGQKHDGKCIDVIYGVKDNKSEIQALRYKKAIWTAGSARSHCSGRGGSFEAASGSAFELEMDDALTAIVEQIVALEEKMLTTQNTLDTILQALMNSEAKVDSEPEDTVKHTISQCDDDGTAKPAEGDETASDDSEKIERLIEIIKGLKQQLKEELKND